MSRAIDYFRGTVTIPADKVEALRATNTDQEAAYAHLMHAAQEDANG